MRKSAAGPEDTDLDYSFGDLLRGYRLAAGLSQEALADRAGLSAHAISDLERGARRFPYPDTVQRLATALALPDVERKRLGNSARRHPAKGELPSNVASKALPIQPNALIGRGREVQDIAERMRRPSVRLLTLTGPGGIGKTRLAIAAAEELVTDFVDGVVFVDLSPVRAAELVIGSIVHVLGAPEVGASPSIELLRNYLQGSRLLLVLDNCEHVLEAAGSVAELLATCPGLKVLATSREALRLRWEHVFPVPALSVPDPAQMPILKRLAEFAGVELFVERAQAASSTFALGSENARTIAALTYRLDGLPLAIELAAARHVSLPPPVLLDRLDQRLDLLRGARDAVVRHQTLRAVVNWSHDLLTVGEKSLYSRLAVFSGGCTADAVDSVCGPELSVGPLQGLVEKSVLRTGSVLSGEVRYWMLETIRADALERLQSSEDSLEIHGRHAAYYVDLAERTDRSWGGRDQAWCFQRMDSELDNVRAALEWCFHNGPSEMGLRLAGAMGSYWELRKYLGEGKLWLDRAVAGSAVGSIAIQAKVLLAAGGVASRRLEFELADMRCQQSLELARTCRDRTCEADSLRTLGINAARAGDSTRADVLFTECLDVCRELGDQRRIAASLFDLGRVALQRHDHPAARKLLHESLELTRVLEDYFDMALVLMDLAKLALDAGDQSGSAAMSREALVLMHDLGDKEATASCLGQLAAVLSRGGDAVVAARLLGAAEALYGLGRNAAAYAENPGDRHLNESTSGAVRTG